MKRLIHPLLLLALTLSPMLAASEQSVEALIKRMPAGKLTENILFLLGLLITIRYSPIQRW